MDILLMGGNSRAEKATNKYINRVISNGGTIQNESYIYNWYRTAFGLGFTESQFRRHYSTNAGVLLNNVAVTNLFLRSEQFDNALWNVINVMKQGTNVALAPDGTLTADLVSANSTSGVHAINQFVNVLSGTTYTLSFYLKKGTGSTAPDWIQVTFGSAGFGASQYANFNITTGTIGNTVGGVANIKGVGNGWFRCSFTATATSSVSAPSGVVFINNDDSSGRVPSYADSVNSDVLIWGAQFQTGNAATDYVKSEGTQGVGSANFGQRMFDLNPYTQIDAVQETAANQPLWDTDAELPSNVRSFRFDGSNDFMSVDDLAIYNNQPTGTLFSVAKDTNRTGGDSAHSVMYISNNTTNERLLLLSRYASNNNFTTAARRLDGDTTITRAAANATGFNALGCIAVWGGNSLIGVFNGTGTASTTFSSGGGLTSATDSASFTIGAFSSTTSRLAGLISSAHAWRAALSLAQLESFRQLEKRFNPFLP